MQRMLAFIDGPPGAGKSTVLSHLAAKYKLTVVPEPIDQWSTALQTVADLNTQITTEISADPHNIPPELYSKMTEYELAIVHLQTLVMVWYQKLSTELYSKKISAQQPNIIVVERTPLSATVFHAMASADDNRSDELRRQLDKIAAQLPSFKGATIFDFRLLPEAAVERLEQRKNPGDNLWNVDSIVKYYTEYDTLIADKELSTTKIDAMEDPDVTATKIYDFLTRHNRQSSHRFRSFFF